MSAEHEFIDVTAAELRDLVAKEIGRTIEIHRASRRVQEPRYVSPSGAVTDEEVDDFVVHNPLLESETREQLTDPGLLGFVASHARATSEWLDEFTNNVSTWAQNDSWLGADLPWLLVETRTPVESKLWRWGSEQPGWLSSSRTALLIASDTLRQGKLLSDLDWRVFEELIGELLEYSGWTVAVTKKSRDGGIDVVADMNDPEIGDIRSVWQAKKYGPSNKVKLHEVRELSAIRDDQRATKGVIVTTSRLTKDAVEWIQRDLYRLGYRDHDQVKAWIEGVELRLTR